MKLGLSSQDTHKYPQVILKPKNESCGAVSSLKGLLVKQVEFYTETLSPSMRVARLLERPS